MCSPRLPEAHFWKPALVNQPSKIHFLDIRMLENRDQWAIFWAFIALLPVLFAFFRLQSPIIILIFVRKNVYFLFMAPLGNLRLALLNLSNAFYITFFILSDWFSHFWCFSTCFLFIFCANFMKMCSSPSVGSIFSKSDFCQYPTQDDVSIPKVASKPPLLERHFRPVLCKK